MGFHPDVDKAIEKAIAAMKASGAEVVDVKIATYNEWNDSEFEVLLYEFKDGLNAYLKASGAPHTSLEALIGWNTAHADQDHAVFRAGDLRTGAEEGAADRAGLPHGPGEVATAGRQGRPAGDARRQPARRAHRAQRLAGVADRPRARRSLPGRRLRHGRRRRHTEPDDSGRRQPGPAGGPHIHGPRLQRAAVDRRSATRSSSSSRRARPPTYKSTLGQ